MPKEAQTQTHRGDYAVCKTKTAIAISESTNAVAISEPNTAIAIIVPTTVIAVSVPTNAVAISTPASTVAISEPMTAIVKSEPTTVLAINEPTATSIAISEPKTAIAISVPTTAIAGSSVSMYEATIDDMENMEIVSINSPTDLNADSETLRPSTSMEAATSIVLDEMDLPFEFRVGATINSKLLYSISEKQFYRLRNGTKQPYGRYVCNVANCKAVLILKDGKLAKAKS